MCCAMWSIFTLSVFSAAFILPCGHEASVFYSSQEANQVLKIQKRANSFLEEVKQGSLERECREEVCDFEEASEIFETKEATLEFWTKYFDGDMCESSPCVDGSCRDGIGQFYCICNKGWEGRQCQYVVAYTNCSISNGGCEHFCNEGQQDNDQYRYCSCASGYRLADNYTSCEPVVEFACGKVQDFSYKTAKVIGGRPGRKGQSPWQVMLSNSAGRFLCGGVLIHPTWVLTAAHCLKSLRTVKLTFGKYYRRRTEESEQTIFADKLLPHENYSEQTSENDIALLHLQRPVLVNKFTIPICLPSKKLAEHLEREATMAVVTGWGSQSEDSKVNYSSVLNYIEIPVAPRNDCVNSMLNSVSENMLCAGILGDNRDSCHGDSGGPMITKFKKTWFLIGLVSWGEGCGATDNFGIYTRVSAYLDWIYQQMKDSILSPNTVTKEG